jgi:hypothetical protein
VQLDLRSALGQPAPVQPQPSSAVWTALSENQLVNSVVNKVLGPSTQWGNVAEVHPLQV